jgi:Tfp pilus assembly protein PilX
MKSSKKLPRQKCRGSALIVAMIFVLVFSALAVSMAAISGTSTQIAENQRTANGARACAESGLEVTRYWLNNLSIPGTTGPSQRLQQIADTLQNTLSSNGITNVVSSFDGSSITIPSVTLDSADEQSFSAVITQIDSETLQIDVTGTRGSLTRTLRAHYKFATRAHTVFDYGVATKGPLALSGNVELETVNVSVGSSVYIESTNSNLALSITGNSQVAGNVGIVNPIANVYLQGAKAGIGGQTGQAAIDNHVSFGAPATEFPAPNPSYFEPYVTGIVDSTTDISDVTLDNVRIAAGTNPTFSGQVILRGIVFVEAPNTISFEGNTTITGIIVGDGDVQDDSGTNQLNFVGNVTSYPVTELPQEDKFAAIRTQTGTFLMAPGFSTSFGGNFHTLNGVIAANGINFHGNAGGTVNGSIINYSQTQMELTGNSDLRINASGTTNMPAGFTPEVILRYDPTAYSEVAF